MDNDQERNIIIYRTADGNASVALFAKDGKIWLNQQQMAELFATSKQTISYHIINILKENELTESSVVKEYLTTAADGKSYNIIFYSLEMIIAVGYREMRVQDRRDLTLDYWRNNVDSLISFQGMDVLQGKGSVSNAEMESYAKNVYATFDAKRKKLEAQQADADDLKLLEDIERRLLNDHNNDLKQ